MKNTILTIAGVVVLLALIYFIYSYFKNKPPVIVVEKTPVPKCNVDYLCDVNQSCVNGVCVANPVVITERLITPVVFGGFNSGRHHDGHHQH